MIKNKNNLLGYRGHRQIDNKQADTITVACTRAVGAGQGRQQRA